MKIGVDLGSTELMIACGPERASFAMGPAFGPAQLHQLLKDFIRLRSLTPTGIAIAVPGWVDEHERITACTTLPAFNGWEASQQMQDLACTIRVLNRSQALLLTQLMQQDLLANPTMTALSVQVGKHLDAAMMTQGRLLVGHRGLAGQLGAMMVRTTHGLKRLEDLAAGRHLAAKLSTTEAKFADRANNGDRQVLQLIYQGGYALGTVLAGVIGLQNPQFISLGGSTLQLPGYFDAVKKAIHEYSLKPSLSGLSLAVSQESKDAAALGAIQLFQIS